MARAFLLILLFALFAHAQLRIGVVDGIDYNQYSIDTQYQFDMRYDGVTGLTAGLSAQYNFVDWLGARIDLMWAERGYRLYRSAFVLQDVDYTLRTHYLMLPVMANFSFGSKKIRGYTDLGIYGGYWLAGHYDGSSINTFYEKESIDEDYEFNSDRDQRFDFGYVADVGIDYFFATHFAVRVEGRCYYSVVSTTKKYMRIDDNRYNTTLALQTGFSYIF